MNYIIEFKTQKDYAKVKNLPFNRPTRYRPDLAENIRKNGFVGAIVLIYTNLIDGSFNYYIADGAHRFIVATQLKVYFVGTVVQREFKTVAEIVKFVASLNNTQLRWCVNDYVSAYAQLNVHDYVALNKVRATCPFSTTTVASMLQGIRTRGTVHRYIQNGTFKCNFLNATVETLQYASDIAVDNKPMNNRMVMPLHYLRSLPIWDAEKFASMYKLHYDEMKGLNLDDYTDLFTSWLV